MNIPQEFKYVSSHEWVNYLSADQVQVGISDFAQKAMGDIVFINLPEVGDMVTAGDILCDMESVKAVEDIYSPVTGKITAINEALLDNPELINNDPYEAWMVEISEITDTEELLDARKYEQICMKEE